MLQVFLDREQNQSPYLTGSLCTRYSTDKRCQSVGVCHVQDERKVIYIFDFIHLQTSFLLKRKTFPRLCFEY